MLFLCFSIFRYRSVSSLKWTVRLQHQHPSPSSCRLLRFCCLSASYRRARCEDGDTGNVSISNSGAPRFCGDWSQLFCSVLSFCCSVCVYPSEWQFSSAIKEREDWVAMTKRIGAVAEIAAISRGTANMKTSLVIRYELAGSWWVGVLQQ